MQLVNRESSAVKDKQLLFPNMLSRNSGKKRIIFKVKAIISQKKAFCFLGFLAKIKLPCKMQSSFRFVVRINDDVLRYEQPYRYESAGSKA
ncbi:hypothetical protein HMPREF5505_0355 [Lactobacillus delbrueckii subsp. lactis DSM 20072]|nr:hypothetical protein HMPREF5505_0355 [Lactobacillus delbrueckii subsp. lactis DSM 20072]